VSNLSVFALNFVKFIEFRTIYNKYYHINKHVCKPFNDPLRILSLLIKVHTNTSHPSFHSSFIIHHSSFIIHHSSFIIHHSSLLIHHSSFVIHHPSFIIHHSSFIIHHSPFIIYHLSFIIYHLSFIIYHLSCIHHSPLLMHLVIRLVLKFATWASVLFPCALVCVYTLYCFHAGMAGSPHIGY
jgi:hypothetical protein